MLGPRYQICSLSVGADVGLFCWGSRLTSAVLLGSKPEIRVLWVEISIYGFITVK
ncbi:hypothetical protein Hanom_Chr14g01333331 [Helianthus anomalus]